MGLPACVQDISIVISSFGVFFILGNLAQPVASQAAWAAGWRLEETLTIMPMYGLNMAAATIVGQNVGAGQFKRAKKCGWQISLLAVVVCSLGAVLMWNFAEAIAQFMTQDVQVAAQGADYIRIVCWSEPFLALWLVLSGAMQGLGSTARPMFVTIYCFNLLRLAACWYLSTLLGAKGVWLGMTASSVVAAVWMAIIWMSVESD